MLNVLIVLNAYLVLTVGENLVLNKPSYQPQTWSSSTYSADKGNDGVLSNTACVDHIPNPYWQADLEGEYWVSSITASSSINSGLADDFRDVLIGVALHPYGSASSDFIQCGKWFSTVETGRTETFDCPQDYAVRYIQLRKSGTHFICFAEIQVTGGLAGAGPEGSVECGDYNFVRTTSEIIDTSTKELMVSSQSECVSACFFYQPCSSFSYNPAANPSCLLATAVTMGTDSTVLTFKLDN